VASASVYVLRENQLLGLDWQTGLQSAVVQMSHSLASEVLPETAMIEGSANTRVIDAQIDHTGQYIYLIEASGRDQRGYPTSTQLVQFNLLTGQRHIVLDRSGIFSFSISPNRSKIAVIYYEADFAWSTQQACVLDLQTSICQPVGLRGLGIPAYWLDNQHCMLMYADVNPIRIVDADTLNVTTITLPADRFIYSSIPISASTLFIANKLRTNVGQPVSFTYYDIQSGAFQDLPYKALNFENYGSVNRGQFSPDQQYLLYSGIKSALIQLSTGQLIREFDIVVNSSWVNASTLLVQGSTDGQALEIFRFDTTTANITQLAIGEAASGIMLIP
jgi:hypothetical protein